MYTKQQYIENSQQYVSAEGPFTVISVFYVENMLAVLHCCCRLELALFKQLGIPNFKN